MLNMKIGDLVRWYEYYADNIVKDAGVGIIIDKRTIQTQGINERCYMHHQYLVSISRKLDRSCTVWFGSHTLDLL